MSIRAGVIVAVALQKVDRAPDTKTCTKSYYQSLQYTDCTVEKCHTEASFKFSLAGVVRLSLLQRLFCLNSRSNGRPLLVFHCLLRLWAHAAFHPDNMADRSAM